MAMSSPSVPLPFTASSKRPDGSTAKITPPPRKGTGFVQPLRAHQHWHVDISYINVQGTPYFLISVLDGMSRLIVHWDLRESMKEFEIELVFQQALEKFPGHHPRIISDNGPQFLARDFKEFIRLVGATHVRTSPYYPQSNEKLERWHGSLKRECVRPASVDKARRRISHYVDHYNNVRLHCALGFITPADKLAGLAQIIFDELDRKLMNGEQVQRGEGTAVANADRTRGWCEDRAVVPARSFTASYQHKCEKPVWHDARLHMARGLIIVANS